MELEHQIEAVLFYKTRPVSYAQLRTLFVVDQETLSNALASLSQHLSTRGIRLLTTDTAVQLVTAPEVSELIEQVRTQEQSRDIGSAGAETLAVILYRGPIARSAIDRIRGVNSATILRNLQVRGLIERSGDDSSESGYLYRVTPTLLSHLGITQKESLPEFNETAEAIAAFMDQQQSIDTV